MRVHLKNVKTRVTIPGSMIIYKKTAFVFDGRNILDQQKLEAIGFLYKGIES